MATAAQAKIGIRPLPKADWSPTSMALVLATTDLCSTSLAVFLGFRIWALINPQIPPLQLPMLLMPVLSVASLAFFGLYPGIGLNAVTQMKRASHALTLVFLLFTAAMFMAKDRWADSRGGFLLAWLLSLAMTPIGRLLMGKLLTLKSNWGIPVVIIGVGSTAQWVIANLRENKILGYRPLACVSEDLLHEAYCEDIPVLGSLDEIERVAKSLNAQHAIVAIPSMPPERLIAHMRSWSKVFPRILIVPNLMGIASLWTEPRDLGGLLAVEIQHKLLDGANQTIKRASDILGSGLAILFAAPIVACAAVLIKIKSPGKVFYVQEREGKDGETIRILKLRSMHREAETMLAQYLASNEEAAAEWSRFYKLRNDPRIIAGIGHFLRWTSIDELPQLWNVLKGEMSLVGPRPFPAYHNSQFDPDFRSLRLHVKPGLTGLWQVGARSNGDLKVQEAMDQYYIRNWSLWLDLYILLRTARAVIKPSGSY
jgi:Undecaprenyl-phosphate galactose phosphotransferase WbaP